MLRDKISGCGSQKITDRKLSASAGHLAVSPERAGMERFSWEIARAGYAQSKMLFRIPWDRDVDYTLLRRMIAFNRAEKAHCKTFWRGKA